jgi:hypothetical protein
MSTPVMIVGADVTHPSPHEPDLPSVASVSMYTFIVYILFPEFYSLSFI